MTQKPKRPSGQCSKSPDRKPTKKRLPPDPERLNDQRASNAKVAIKTYRKVCYVDIEDALGDLLADLMHLCDRKPRLGNFDAVHARAIRRYKEETATDAEYETWGRLDG